MSMKGQSLIEILIGLAAIVVVSSSITVVVLTALNNTQLTKNQNLATSYAQEGMELVRTIRNNTFSTFSGYSGLYCLPKGVTTPTYIQDSCADTPVTCPQNIDIFVRRICVTKNASECNNQTKVASQVFWSDSKCTDSSNLYCHQAQLVSCMSDYNVLPTP